MELRSKRHIWIPALLLIYGAAMGCTFGRELISSGRGWYLALVLGIDLLLCIALFFALRKKQNLQNKRKDLLKKTL